MRKHELVLHLYLDDTSCVVRHSYVNCLICFVVIATVVRRRYFDIELHDTTGCSGQIFA
jgi:hypothetical protein